MKNSHIETWYNSKGLPVKIRVTQCGGCDFVVQGADLGPSLSGLGISEMNYCRIRTTTEGIGEALKAAWPDQDFPRSFAASLAK